MAATRRGQWIYLVASGLFSLGFAIALAVGARLYLLHAVTIGAVFMFMQYAGMMAQPIVLIGTQLQQFQTASASLTRIRASAGDRAAADGRAGARLGRLAPLRAEGRLRARQLRLSGRRAGAAATSR